MYIGNNSSLGKRTWTYNKLVQIYILDCSEAEYAHPEHSNRIYVCLMLDKQYWFVWRPSHSINNLQGGGGGGGILKVNFFFFFFFFFSRLLLFLPWWMRKSCLLQEEKNNNNLLRIFKKSTSLKILGRLVFWNSALKKIIGRVKVLLFPWKIIKLLCKWVKSVFWKAF